MTPETVRLSEEEREVLLESVIGWARAEPGADALAAWPAVEAAVESILTARSAQHNDRADAAEAEASNYSADHDRRGERLWRLAALTGYVPCESDNDATAELVVTDALAARRPADEDGLRAALSDAIDELVECRSFISVETRHYPTVTAISTEIERLRAVLARHPAEPGAQEAGHPTPTHGDHQQEDT